MTFLHAWNKHFAETAESCQDVCNGSTCKEFCTFGRACFYRFIWAPWTGGLFSLQQF